MDFPSRRPAYVQAQIPSWRPMGTYGLLVAMGVVFVLEMATTSDRWFHDLWTIDTDWPLRPWSLVTSTLSHGGVTHILFNGLVLFLFGPSLERILGLRRFVALFFLAGAVTGVFQVTLSALVTGATVVPALGASGAIMMCFGALAMLMPRSKVLIYGILPVPFWAAAVGYAFLDVLGALDPYSDIGNFAHLSGMALGVWLGWYLKRDMARRGLVLVHA